MNWKKKLLKESHIYVIIDKKTCRGKSIFKIINEIKDNHCSIIQLRDKESKKETILKDAYTLRKLLIKKKIIFIINDYMDIAKIVDCDGIHLGQQDLSIETARRILGKDKIIGVSCHNLRQAKIAQEKGADYLSIGPVFTTPTKPKLKAIGLSLIKEIKKKIRIPVFAIGGINEDNLNKLLFLRLKRVAICSAICKAKNIPFTLRKISQVLNRKK